MTVSSSSGDLLAGEADGFVRKIDTAGHISTIVTPVVTLPEGSQLPRSADSLLLDHHGNLIVSDGAGAILSYSPSGARTLLAGSSLAGVSGDGGPATQALLDGAAGMAYTASGDLLFCDRYNNVIWKIDTQGIITTIAGTGQAGFAGDGGAATIAQLNRPAKLAVDLGANIYITDSGNNRIRRIDPNGLITTLAGTGTTLSSLVTDGDGGLATAAPVLGPSGIAVDAAGNVFFGQFGGVRQIDTVGVIHTIAGGGTVDLNSF